MVVGIGLGDCCVEVGSGVDSGGLKYLSSVPRIFKMAISDTYEGASAVLLSEDAGAGAV